MENEFFMEAFLKHSCFDAFGKWRVIKALNICIDLELR